MQHIKNEYRIFVKRYGYFSFAKNISKNIGKNISKNLSNKNSQKLNDLVEATGDEQKFLDDLR